MADHQWQVDDHIGTLTLDRPDRGNSFTFAMVDAMTEVIRRAGTDDAVRVIVITGSGDRSFCSGMDTREFAGLELTPLQRKHQLHEHVHELIRAIDSCDKPIIAAINGHAQGAGLDLALACDMRVMSRSARVSEVYVSIGLTSGAGGAYFLPRIVGRGKAMEMLLTGAAIDAVEAERIGLVNSLADSDNLPAAARALAASIAKHAPTTVRVMKRSIDQASRSDLDTALDLLSSHYAVLVSTDDAAEAIAAMRDKRTPNYTGN
ncbi:enoyl-CoA hydratase/isomerase family protein [Williamsia sp. DF01-3]|uniref:enoyl-CoA hydratase/isomerase family protein n=1 Tax=Williamsia sp. DF01-3 TaxID=2934157 RepID=UPI001FF53C57|nr:enoyl-CoA hydratase-related protein [Williamsia sp. DF01-3]MCK0516716.1 enoyl-CoA hydratase-related protein [Williamsia sp. DF01-3]